MQVIENASIVGHSFGENNVIVFENAVSGETYSLKNPNGFDFEMGIEGKLIFVEEPVMQLVSFEPVMAEELV